MFFEDDAPDVAAALDEMRTSLTKAELAGPDKPAEISQESLRSWIELFGITVEAAEQADLEDW